MPLERVTLGAAWSVRISDLTAADHLSVECAMCRASWRVATWQLHARFPSHQRILDLERREMVCRKCGHRGSFSWAVVRATAP